MFVGVLQIELIVPGSLSLKDKRRVVKSLKDRLHREHLVSVAEVGALDHQRVALLGVGLVGASGERIGATFDRILQKVRAIPDARLGDVARDIVPCEAITVADRMEDGSPLWTEDERRGGAS